MEVTLLFCEERYYWNDMKFLSYEDAERVLRQKNITIKKVEFCRASLDRKCCSSRI